MDECKTKYPILLLHGAGFRDLKMPLYWGRIPGELKKRGADVFYGRQDCWADVETNAQFLVHRLDEVLRLSSAEKVNIIAHSKGGLEARALASSFGCAGKIASITTLGTPHHGSKAMDAVCGKIPGAAFRLAALAVNNWIKLIGDKRPDFISLCSGFTTQEAERFNAENPDARGVLYQSFGAAMKTPFSDINLSTANRIVQLLEGENDGLVPLSSAKWGENFTVLRPHGMRGVSHLDLIDLRRTPMKIGGNKSDITDIYVSIVRDLKSGGL